MPPRVCFVSPFAYGALAGVDTGHIGGIETQTSLMARWLAARGCSVSMVTWDEGQPNGVENPALAVSAHLRLAGSDHGSAGSLDAARPSLSRACSPGSAAAYADNTSWAGVPTAGYRHLRLDWEASVGAVVVHRAIQRLLGRVAAVAAPEIQAFH